MTATISCTGCKHGYADTALFCPNCGRPKLREATGDVLVGKLLGERFQVQALLGQGGSGTIYRAEHVTLRRRVAIKVLHTELSRDELAVERFRREATTVADIDNEHIVEIHDFGRTPDGRLYLAMEMLEGETLDAVLARDKQLSFERAADILIQVGEALMEAHAIGYVHRDLRPRNVYLTTRRGKPNFVKLLDFGLAKLVDTDTPAPATSVGMTFGDPRYMSPEQARGDVIDRRADIYQLGCVAYEMLTGAPPFQGTRVFDILTRQVTEAPAPLPTRRPGVPLWMEAAVAKMLAKDPDNRFATTSRMVEALRVGLATGEVMEDEIARTPESVPPASVSRVMQRMGLDPDGANPSSTMAGTAAPLPPLSPPVVVAPAPVVAPVAAAEPSDPPRRRTGTPRVGVPIVASVEVASQPVVAGLIEPPALVPRARRASSQVDDANNISQSWYAEGDRESAEAEGSRARKLISPSMADLSLYDDEPPTGRRWGLIIGALSLLALGGVVVFALTRGGDERKDGASPEPPIASTGVPVDAAPSTIMDPVDAGVAPAPDAAPATASKPVRSTPTPRRGNDRVARPPAPSGDGSFIPGSDPVFRRPGGETVTPAADPPVTSFPPTPVVAPGPTGVSGVDGPLDPYGNPTDPPASDGSTTEQRAVFFANVGAQQLSSGDTASAAASFKKALELDARNVIATIGIGEIALRQGLFGDAIAHLRKAARLAPRSARVFTLLGEAYLNSGNSGEAASNFKKALQLEPDNARARDGYNEASSRVPPPADE